MLNSIDVQKDVEYLRAIGLTQEKIELLSSSLILEKRYHEAELARIKVNKERSLTRKAEADSIRSSTLAITNAVAAVNPALVVPALALGSLVYLDSLSEKGLVTAVGSTTREAANGVVNVVGPTTRGIGNSVVESTAKTIRQLLS